MGNRVRGKCWFNDEGEVVSVAAVRLWPLMWLGFLAFSQRSSGQPSLIQQPQLVFSCFIYYCDLLDNGLSSSWTNGAQNHTERWIGLVMVLVG